MLEIITCKTYIKAKQWFWWEHTQRQCVSWLRERSPTTVGVQVIGALVCLWPLPSVKHRRAIMFIFWFYDNFQYLNFIAKENFDILLMTAAAPCCVYGTGNEGTSPQCVWCKQEKGVTSLVFSSSRYKYGWVASSRQILHEEVSLHLGPNCHHHCICTAAGKPDTTLQLWGHAFIFTFNADINLSSKILYNL